MNKRLASRRNHCSCGSWAEPLEPRRLLAVDPAALLAQGFEPIEWNGQQSYAVPGQWIVRLDGISGNGRQQLQKLNTLLAGVRRDLQASQHLGEDGLALVKAPKGLKHGQLQAALRGLKNFRFIEPDFAIWGQATVNDPGFSQLWGLHNTGQSGGRIDADIDAPEAWDITRGNGSVVVGVIDSGVDYNHPDLAGAIWSNPGEIAGDGIDNDGNGYVDDVRGWNFHSNNNNPMDDNNHGTHVAGTIAAVGNNGIGVAGVANAKILPLKFLGADNTGSTSNAISAINYATKLRRDHGINIRVTNNSWGGGGASTALQNAIIAHRDAGIMFVAAAGNGGSDSIGDNNDSTPYWPSNYNYSNVIAVAATDRHDNLASFSNFGPSTVHLGAPGASIYSTLRSGSYGTMSGTSMAAPHVAGVVALAWSLMPSATMQQVRDTILQSVDLVSSLNGKVSSNGRLNAHNALLRLSFANLNNGVLTVTGTGGNDTMALALKGGNIVAELNGQSREFAASSVASIIYNAGGGNDRIDVRDVPASKNVTINGGSGDDEINVGLGTQLANILSNITVNGYAGNDRIAFSDVAATSTGSFVYTVNAGSFTRSGLPTTSHNSVEQITLNTSNGSDRIDLNGGVSALTTININANGGNDDLYLAPNTGRLSTIPAVLNVAMGTGTDRIFVNDSQEPNAQWFQISDQLVNRDAGFRMSYSGAEFVEVFGGIGADRFDLTPGSATEFKVHGNDPGPPAFGDVYRMNLSGATGMQHTPGETGAGRFTFSNRQPISYTGIERLEVDELVRRPYLGSPFAVGSTPITIQAEHFDVAGQNITYYDTTPGNTPGSFRAGEDVDIRSTADAGGGHRITATVAGEWTEYTINVAQAGSYRLDLRVACAANGARVRVLLDGNDITGAISVPNTGAWDSLTTLTKDVVLPQGEHILRLVTDAHGSGGEGGSYNWLRLTQLVSNEEPPPPPPPPPPGDSPVVVTVTQAAHVQSGSNVDLNYNSSTQLVVKKSGSGSNDRETFIRLDLAQVPAEISSAKLRLNGQLNSTTNASINIAAFGSAGIGWDETTLTWNNRPATNTAALSTATITGTTQRTYELDLTSYIRQLKSSGAIAATIVLRGTAATDSSAGFISDEAASGGPQLIVAGTTSEPSEHFTVETEKGAYVRGGTYASNNFGQSSEIAVKLGDAATTREGFIGFDLTGLTRVSSAKLRLFGRLSATGSVQLNVHNAASTTWSEDTLTWNNRPAVNAAVHGSVTLNTTANQWYEIELTSFINAELAAGRQAVTLVLRGAVVTSPFAIFASDELMDGPQLKIAT